MDVVEGAFFHSDLVTIFGWMALGHMACYYLAISACVICSIHCIAKTEVLVHMLWNNLLKSSCCFWRSVAGIGY